MVDRRCLLPNQFGCWFTEFEGRKELRWIGDAIDHALEFTVERDTKAQKHGLVLSADRGTAEGLDAVAVAAREGFAPRSTVFLDIERMERMPTAMRDYYRAWARALLKDGRYLPGVYVHAWNAQTVHDDLKAEFVAAGQKEEPRIWVATRALMRLKSCSNLSSELAANATVATPRSKLMCSLVPISSC